MVHLTYLKSCAQVRLDKLVHINMNYGEWTTTTQNICGLIAGLVLPLAAISCLVVSYLCKIISCLKHCISDKSVCHLKGSCLNTHNFNVKTVMLIVPCRNTFLQHKKLHHNDISILRTMFVHSSGGVRIGSRCTWARYKATMSSVSTT